jgi:flavin reductase (DIM6/NTAB) family NADH-FMN oxidoreductase RutF
MLFSSEYFARTGGNMEAIASEMPGGERKLVEPDSYRRTISRFASGVTVITTRDGGHDYGLTASAVTSLSLDPPMLLVCVNKASTTRQALVRSRVFAVNILQEQQSALARHFAGSQADKFAGLHVSYGELGVPLLDDVLATLECRVTAIVDGGTHAIFLAEVQSVHATEGMPLTYFRGRMGSFTCMGDQDEASLWRNMQWEDVA